MVLLLPVVPDPLQVLIVILVLGMDTMEYPGGYGVEGTGRYISPLREYYYTIGITGNAVFPYIYPTSTPHSPSGPWQYIYS